MIGRAVLLLVLCAGLAGPGLAQAGPRLPSNGSEVLEVLPWSGDARQRELRGLRTALMAAPNDLARATGVARRYIEAGRREADPRYFGYAQAALAPWWKMSDPPSEVRLLRATLLQSDHRFDEALADLKAVTDRDPGNAQAWLTRATVETVRADYGAARRSCARLATLADPLVAASCAANVGAVTGNLADSERLLAAAHTRAGSGDPAIDSWVLTGLAEMAARRGDAQTASQRFERALQLAPGDAYLLGAYADFLLDAQRVSDAARLLRAHQRADGLLLRYALALQRSGGNGQELAAARTELAARFAAAARRGDGIHLRDHARYALGVQGDARAALALARRNWTSQKEPQDARVLLEAAVAARDPGAAREVLDWITNNGVEDVQLRRLVVQLKGSAS